MNVAVLRLVATSHLVDVKRGGWEGCCACLPRLGMTSSPSSSLTIDWVCLLGVDAVLWHRSCGGCGWLVTTDVVCHCVVSILVVWQALIVLDGSGGWVASLMVAVGRKKRCGNV